ncbi:MAG: RsmD family RNA methyltransferase [Alphaproteobacteria bacterium]|nr:RsmD family RNA methyltransferase [Alphaproteobacteria bacterium]
MRVIAGLWRGKKLRAPARGTRPTSDRAKETLFNLINVWLYKTGRTLGGLIFCDVFTGSGAVGIEAMSRGCKTAYFFEKDAAAMDVIRRNIQLIDGATLVLGDALRPPPTKVPAGIVFMDAPYGQELWVRALLAFNARGWIDGNTLVIIEIDKKDPRVPPAGFILLQERGEGRNTFLFLQRSPA